jgi:hypothetical protein
MTFLTTFLTHPTLVDPHPAKSDRTLLREMGICPAKIRILKPPPPIDLIDPITIRETITVLLVLVGGVGMVMGIWAVAWMAVTAVVGLVK